MNRFRCQYQKGKVCVSEVYESENTITSAQILLSLAKLAIKVKNEVNSKTGGIVALKVLEIHEFVMKCIHGKECVGKGPTNTYKLNKNAKKKISKSERVDLEFYGNYGISDDTSSLTRYIKLYRKSKMWN